MFSRHPRSVFMLRTHFIKHFFGFPPHFLVIHTLLDHNTSYLPTPFFSDLTDKVDKVPTADITITNTGQTWATALASLLSQIDGSKVTIHSKIRYTGAIFNVSIIDAVNKEYRYSCANGYNPVVSVQILRMFSGYCNNILFSMSQGGTPTITNNSATTIAGDILFYY